jgi:fructose-bisphosphate aldolase class I
MMAGVRVDVGTRPLAGTRGETITEGLDGLAPRLRGFAGLGARFALWRAVMQIGPGSPSPLAVRANAHALGRFTSACQDTGLVALVEPAVLTDGSRSLGRYEAVTSVVLLEVMNSLQDYEVDFTGVVLRLTMAPPDGAPATPGEVAESTIGTLSGLPTALAGVAFSSGGQHPRRATGNLAAMQHVLCLWPLTFAFGRGLTGPALAGWRGEPGRVRAGQRALARRVSMNVAAVEGRYTAQLERDLLPA